MVPQKVNLVLGGVSTYTQMILSQKWASPCKTKLDGCTFRMGTRLKVRTSAGMNNDDGMVRYDRMRCVDI